MEFRYNYEDLNLLIKLSKDPNYLPDKRHDPHSKKDRALYLKKVLDSYQVEVTIKSDEGEQGLIFPTVLLTAHNNEEEIAEEFDDNFEQVLLPMILEYLENLEFPLFP